MNQRDTNNLMLSPKRIAEKAAILETNLTKNVAKQTNPSELKIVIDRDKFPDAVILKALLQLTPRHNIQPRTYLLALRDFLKKDLPPEVTESFEINLDMDNREEFDDPNSMTRVFRAIASRTHLTIIVQGIAPVPSFNGSIAKSYFSSELSAGKISKSGIIDFKEINKFPIVNSEDNLFYIQHEQQGIPGLSYEGKTLSVDESIPYPIEIGAGVERIDDIDSTGKSKGYFLRSRRTGVVLLDRNKKGRIIGIDILEKVEVKKLDYSTGNIGSQYTCPVSMRVGEICSGFKIRVNGLVEADILDGGEIITNNEAIIIKSQSGASVLALKDISAVSITHSKLISEKGCITVQNELIDSELSAPKIIFEKNKGLVTNNKIETEKLVLQGCYFSAENIIYFGNSLFVDEKDNMKSLEKTRAEKLASQNNEKLLMGQLQLELKRLTKLVTANPDLLEYIKPLIIATKTMDYHIIYSKLEMIEKRNNTKVVSSVRKIFETLEKIPETIEIYAKKEVRLHTEIKEIRERMTKMSINIEGYLRRAATLKIYCGIQDNKKKIEPDYMIESEDSKDTYIMVKGTYSRQNGFELSQ